MIAVDTNLLVYAHRADSVWHQPARECLEKLAAGGSRWAIPWPCLYEFYAVVTHPRIFPKPTPPTTALQACQEFASSPQVRLLSETEDFVEKLGGFIRGLDLKGPKIHDARVAVLCHVHGARELWSCDRDFSRFKFLKVVNPVVGGR